MKYEAGSKGANSPEFACGRLYDELRRGLPPNF